jgi:hypothetical protein
VEDGATFECKVRYENGSEEAWTMEQLNGEGTVRTAQVLQTKSAVTILQRDDLGNVEVSSARSVK